MESPPRRGTGAVLVAALVVLAAAAVFTAAGAAQADSADGERIHVDDDWRDANESETVEGGYVLGENATASIQAAVDLAGDGDTVVVHEGTYEPDSRIEISDPGVSLVGESESDVVIDGSNLDGHDDTWSGAWTVYVSDGANDVTLSGFTVVNAPHDAVKANFVEGLTVSDVTVTGSSLSEMDLNNVRNATIEDVTLTGDGTKGVGLALSGVENVTLDGISSSGNTWGGVGVFTTTSSQTDGSPDGWEFINTPTDVTIRNGDFAESVAVYTEDGDSHTVDSTELHGPAFDYAVTAPEYRDGDFTFYAADSQDAVGIASADTINDFAVGDGTTVQERATGDFWVGGDMSIQDAVDGATDGTTVRVAAGTYIEQVHVTENVTLVGAGEDETTIESPTTLSESFTKPSGDTGYPVVLAENADVDLESLTVDGANNGDDNHEFYGVVYSNASGAVSEVTVRNVMNAEFSGIQHGIAVGAYNGDGQQRTVTLEDSTLVDYQKGGLVASGPGLTARVTDNEITGQGPTDVTGQNGVQISGSAAAVIEGNVVSDNEYTSDGWLATNVLVYGASESQTTTIRNNDISDGTAGLAVDESANVDIADNDFANHTWHVTDYTERLDLGTVFDANAFDAAAYTESERGASGQSVYGSVQQAVDAAESGDTIQLSEGTFEISTENADGRLTNFSDGVTLTGAGEGETVLETSADWGVYVSGTENVTLSEFTVDGVDDGWGSATVKADYSETLTIRNVTAESGYIGFDLNDVRDSTLRDVTVTGHSALGVSLKGVADVTADGLTTVGSPWGGVGIYNGPGSNGGPADWENVDTTDDVTIRNHTSEGEPVPVYTQAAEAGDVGDVRLQDATHVVENPNHKADGSDYFALYQYSQSAAVEYAANDSIHADASTSTVQPVETRDGSTEPTETYVVSPAMDAHVALDQAGEDATVLLLDGTHELGAGLDVETDGVTVRGESRAGTTLDASAVPGRAVETPSSGEVSDLTVTDLTVVGPQQGNDGNYALKFQPTTEDVTVRNVLVEESDETGIDFNGVEGVTVADTTVENTSANGVALTDTRNVTIRNATLTGNDWGGVALYTSSYAAEQGTYNVTVSDSTVTDTGSGIYAQNSGEVDEPFGDVTIRDTTFADNDAHVVGLGDDELAWFDYDAALADNDFDRAVTVRDDDGVAAPVVATSVETGVEVADAGETVALEPGTYPTNATLSKSVTLTGPGADASEQARLVPESGDQDRILTLNASDVTVEDLAFDGEETSVTAVGFWSEGEYASGATIRENSFDAVDYGVFLYPEGGEVSTGTVVAENTFTNVDQRAVLLYNNAYASVVDNDMTDVRIGVQTGNHWRGAGDAEPVIAGNDVDARDLGVFHNLQYQNAANWTVADNELSGGEGVLLTSISGDRTATVTNNTITDVETGLTAWNLDATAGVVVSDLTVENATTAVNVTDVEQYGTESVALSLRGLTVTDAETGVLATDANATAGGVAVGLFESTVEADTGLRVTGDADVTAEYVDFAGSGLAVNETGTAAVDADLNHFGDDPASAVAGNVTYDPFLTAPPSETSGDAGTLQQFGHDFAVPGDGQPRAVGFPGDVNATLGEVFGEFDGAVYRWNATAGEWAVPDAGTPVDALDAVVVVAEERATYTVDYADASPPGAPGQADLDAGWNFVAAPLSGPVETAFGATSGGDVVRVVSAIPGPESQPYGLNASTFGTYTPSDSGIAVASGGPTVSPFTGYWVYASDDGGLAGATYPGITLADEIAALDADGGQTTDQGES